MFIKNTFKVLIVMTALITANNMYAATYARSVCDKGTLAVPCNDGRWEFSGDALYYGSSAQDIIGSNVFVPNSIAINKVGADYGWGFRLGTGVHFSTANALLLEWYHYRKTTPQVQDNSGRHFTNEDMSVTSKPDIINLSLEQTLNVGELLELGIFEGLQYAHLVSDARLQSTSPETTFMSYDYNTIGPRVALDANYKTRYALAAFGKIGFGILYSHSVYTQTARSPSATSFTREKINNTIYEYDGSVGLKLQGNVEQGLLEAAVAWDIISYGRGVEAFNWSGLRFGLRYVA